MSLLGESVHQNDGSSFSYPSGSNNSSSYFGSVDSSQNSQKVTSHLSSSEGRAVEMDQSITYALQDPLWRPSANTDEKLLMTYQLPSR